MARHHLSVVVDDELFAAIKIAMKHRKQSASVILRDELRKILLGQQGPDAAEERGWQEGYNRGYADFQSTISAAMRQGLAKHVGNV